MTFDTLLATGEPTPADLVVAFFDLTGFWKAQQSREDAEVFAMVAELAERADRGARAAGGAVVKLIGDAALLVFPRERADDAVAALVALKAEVDGWLEDAGYRCRMIVKVHAGPLVAGPIGGRFDVIGRTVSRAALLTSHGLALSPEAFRALSPAARQAWKKHTPPIRYIPTSEPHRDGRA